jgi:predicted phosphodiesterase
MRIAIVSDTHGNLTAFEAVLADLKQMAPDLIIHGGDLADGGANPAAIVDRIRDLGWPGVLGNTEEMLVKPETLTAFARQAPVNLQPLFKAIEETAAATRAALGDERLAWLGALPRAQIHECLALVHASPGDAWRAPAPEASDAELEAVYGPLGCGITVYAHIHRPYIRRAAGNRRAEGFTIANTGSVSLSYDGDRRAAYLLVTDSELSIRRVEYDLERELAILAGSGVPHAGWIGAMLRSARFEMP